MSSTELEYVQDAMNRHHLAGKGKYNKLSAEWFSEHFGFKDTFLTPSCTDALEMTAVLLRLEPGDEVIVPSYTFVSTANAFAIHGASIVYADSKSNSPNIDPESVQKQITSHTKAIVAVHYGGFPCDIIRLREIADKHNIVLIEDAACALGSSIGDKKIGSIGDFATFSFHETKNLTCGKGGMLVVNNRTFLERAAIVWEKGTNRAAFFKGLVDKYGWVDFGSSYMMSELQASFLYGQLLEYDKVQSKRMKIWEAYKSHFNAIKETSGKKHNAHCFYLLLPSEKDRDSLMKELQAKGIQAVFHYQALHNSDFSKAQFGEYDCPNADKFEKVLLRLPLHVYLVENQVINTINEVELWLNEQKVEFVYDK